MTNTDYCEICLAEVKVPPWFNEKKEVAYCCKACNVIDILLKDRYSDDIVAAIRERHRSQ